jgi:branched-chain amino acid transport system ATP-binding protein
MPHFAVEHLSMSFGGLKAVDDVSFEIQEGAIHGLIGPNGAGKTTVFNCISGLYKPTGGRVTFAEHDLTQLRPHDIAQVGVARTFQNIELFRQMSALDNVIVGQHSHLRAGVLASAFSRKWTQHEERQSRVRVQEIMRFLGLEEVQHLPAGSLSFGHQKRLELGRALALEPQMLLLDEPASGMNTQETIALRHLIQDIRQRFNITILLVEHDMGLVMKLCDQISVLNFGVKIAEGTPREIQITPRSSNTGEERRCRRHGLETFYGNIRAQGYLPDARREHRYPPRANVLARPRPSRQSLDHASGDWHDRVYGPAY